MTWVSMSAEPHLHGVPHTLGPFLSLTIFIIFTHCTLYTTRGGVGSFVTGIAPREKRRGLILTVGIDGWSDG